MDTKIEFPCSYPIKVIAISSKVSVEEVFILSKAHFLELSERDIHAHYSRDKKYVSYRLNVIAESENQLKAFHLSLSAQQGIKMIL